jgi:cobaltochelatase CobS
MAQYRYTADNRSALRAAVTSSPLWDAYRQRNGLSSSSLSVDDLEEAAKAFGIAFDIFGTPKGGKRSGGFVPKPRPHASASLKARASELAAYLSEAQCDYLADIFADGAKHGDALTAKQFDTVFDMLGRAEYKRRAASEGKAQAASESAWGAIKEAAEAPKAAAPNGDTASQLAALLASIAGQAVNAEQIAEIVDSRIKAALASVPSVRIELKGFDGELRELKGHRHPKFATLLKAATSRMANGFAPNIWISGPAGSGKTHAGKMLADALGLPFQLNGAISMPHELLGFIDAAGTYHATPFWEAYEKGGVYMFDEVDGADNAALLALNAALANGFATFPHKRVERHPDCIILASANTWGLGATADYVGRSKIDAAFLSRFPVRIAWDYDTALEIAISGNESFARRVIAARERARAAGLKVIIDPRASQAGAALIANGMTEAEAAAATYLANLSADQAAIVEGGR